MRELALSFAHHKKCKMILLLLTCLLSIKSDTMDTLTNKDYLTTNKMEELIGGWSGEIRNHAVFIEIDKNGSMELDIQGGDGKKFQILSYEDSTLNVHEIRNGRTYISGLDPDLSEEDRNELLKNIITFQIEYSLVDNQLNLMIDGIDLHFTRCEDQSCKEAKPDNMRFSAWTFKVDLPRIDDLSWEEFPEEETDYFTFAKAIDEINLPKNDFQIASKLAYGLLIKDLDYLHSLVENDVIHLIVDKSTTFRDIHSAFAEYTSEHPITKLYIVALNKENKTIRKSFTLEKTISDQLGITVEDWVNQ